MFTGHFQCCLTQSSVAGKWFALAAMIEWLKSTFSFADFVDYNPKQ